MVKIGSEICDRGSAIYAGISVGLHLFGRFCDFGGKNPCPSPAASYVIKCKTLKFQRFIHMIVLAPALGLLKKEKNLHHFSKKGRNGGDTSSHSPKS